MLSASHLVTATKHIKNKTVAVWKDQVSRGTVLLRVNILLGYYWLLDWAQRRQKYAGSLEYGLKRHECAHRSARENRGPSPCAFSPSHFLFSELFQS